MTERLHAEAIVPYTIDDVALVSTTATESVDEWDVDDVYVFGQTARSDTTHRIYKSLIGEAGTVTITIATPGVVTKAGHGNANGTPVIFTTTGALPTGITAGSLYYLVNVTTDTFQIAATAGGAAINTSGTQSGVHTATFNPNKGYDPTVEANRTGENAKWLDVAPTNAWAMFDALNGTQTERAGGIEVSVDTVGWIDRVAAGNLNATSIQVVAEADGDEVYNKTHSLIDDSGVYDLWTYLTAPIVYRRDIVLEMPAYPDMSFDVTIDGADTTKAGNLVFGTALYLGIPQRGSRVGTKSYSKVEEDPEFGNYIVVKRRGRSKRATVQMKVETDRVDALQDALNDLDGVPIYWNISPKYSRTQIFGFYRGFESVFSEWGWDDYDLILEGVT